MAEKEIKVKMTFNTSKFEEGIKNIGQNMRLLDSQIKAGISGLDNFDRSTDSLNVKADALSW